MKPLLIAPPTLDGDGDGAGDGDGDDGVKRRWG